MEWAIFGISTFIVLLVLGIWADHLRRKRKLAVQELVSKERLMAIEKGLPIPDWDAAMLTPANPDSEESQSRRIRMFRFGSLCVGLVLIFAGLGMIVGFQFSGDPEFVKMASLGALPLMTGGGLILFYVLTRGAA